MFPNTHMDPSTFMYPNMNANMCPNMPPFMFPNMNPLMYPNMPPFMLQNIPQNIPPTMFPNMSVNVPIGIIPDMSVNAKKGTKKESVKKEPAKEEPVKKAEKQKLTNRERKDLKKAHAVIRRERKRAIARERVNEENEVRRVVGEPLIVWGKKKMFDRCSKEQKPLQREKAKRIGALVSEIKNR